MPEPARTRGESAGSPTGDAAALVVNYNGGPGLLRCLTSVLDQQPPPAEVLVVDNASRDGSADALPAGVRLLRRARNDGYAAAVRDGLAATRAPLVLLLNADVELLPGCLAAAVRALCADHLVGAVAPRVLQARDPALLDATAIGLTSRLTQINCDHGLREDEIEREPRDVLGPLGGAGLWRRQAIERAGGLCTLYFLYWEDMDLALRLGRAGYACRTVPEARVLHAGGASARHGSRGNVFRMVRNHWACLLAALPGPILREHWFAFLVAPLRAATLYALRGAPLAAAAGLLAGVAWLPAAYAQRRRLPRAGTGGKAAERLRPLLAAADASRARMKSAR